MLLCPNNSRLAPPQAKIVLQLCLQSAFFLNSTLEDSFHLKLKTKSGWDFCFQGRVVRGVSSLETSKQVLRGRWKCRARRSCTKLFGALLQQVLPSWNSCMMWCLRQLLFSCFPDGERWSTAVAEVLKWWHIVARVILRAFQRRYWGILGNYLQRPEVRVAVNPHLARIRTTFGQGQGRLLRQLSNLAPK